MDIKRCSICNLESADEKFSIPGMKFTFLHGEPFVCELCFYRALGQEGVWKEEVEAKLKERVL